MTDPQAARRMTQLAGQISKRVAAEKAVKDARALVSAGHKAAVDKIASKIVPHVDALFVHASSNRVRLTDDGERQSADLETGRYTWLLTRHVEVGDDDAVVERIQEMVEEEEGQDEPDQELLDRLRSFLRPPKIELNREAMLLEENRETAGEIEGVDIVEQELFSALPNDAEVDEKKVRPLLQRVISLEEEEEDEEGDEDDEEEE